MASELFHKILSEVTPETEQKVRRYLDRIDKLSQRATDMRMLIAAKIGDKCKDRIETCERLNIDIEELINWLSGTHDFTLFEIAKIENYLGEKILNL